MDVFLQVSINNKPRVGFLRLVMMLCDDDVHAFRRRRVSSYIIQILLSYYYLTVFILQHTNFPSDESNSFSS